MLRYRRRWAKVELAAAIALLLTCGDGEERAEVYGCAADRKQASIVFECGGGYGADVPGAGQARQNTGCHQALDLQPTGSYLSGAVGRCGNKHGFNTHGVVFDELHTQPNRKLFDVMTKGSGDARMQPLYFLITTAGDNQNSICWEVHQKGAGYHRWQKARPHLLSRHLRRRAGG
jgi:phage terminase large subunit-like protein